MAEHTSQTTAPQLTDTVFMIRPNEFGFNVETVSDNAFMHEPTESETDVRDKAMAEFNNMAQVLQAHDIEVLTLDSPPGTPDAVFPNNWVSHGTEGGGDGTLVIYPMRAPTRRAERQEDNLKALLTTVDIRSPKVVDLSSDEKEGKILEGTGSLVLDRKNKVAFAMESQRTTEAEFKKWCDTMGYEPVFFHAYDENRLPIYHTNVVMSIGDGFVVACPEAITDTEERAMFETKLAEHGRKVIPITLDQVLNFCGNILEVKSKKGDPKIVMSQAAFDKFTPEQRQQLEQFGELVAVPIPTIEYVGGGSARCMLAEVFPPAK